jgi:hypothetical protein
VTEDLVIERNRELTRLATGELPLPLAQTLSENNKSQSGGGKWRSSSEKTVKNHINNIFSKLHLYDRAQAMLYAIRKGLVKIE